MDVYQNICEDMNKNYRFASKDDRFTFRIRPKDLDTIRMSDDSDLLKDEGQTNFASKQQSTEESKLKEKVNQVKAKIQIVDKSLEAVSTLYQYLFQKKEKLLRECLNFQNHANELDKYILDSKLSQQVSDLYNQNEYNKTHETVSFGVKMDTDLTTNLWKDDIKIIKPLVLNIGKQFGILLERDETTKQKIISKPPQNNHYTRESIDKQRFNKIHFSEKINSNSISISKSPNLSTKFLRLSSPSNKLVSSLQHKNIFQQLRRQRIHFDQFKNNLS